MAPDYDHLTLMQKVEVFEHALANTNGDDLAKLLWLKSPSSEVKEFIVFCLDQMTHSELGFPSQPFFFDLFTWSSSLWIGR